MYWSAGRPRPPPLPGADEDSVTPACEPFRRTCLEGRRWLEAQVLSRLAEGIEQSLDHGRIHICRGGHRVSRIQEDRYLHAQCRQDAVADAAVAHHVGILQQQEVNPARL